MTAPLDLDAVWRSLREEPPWAAEGWVPALLAEVERLRAKVGELLADTLVSELRAIVAKQANDEGLWFVAQTAPEAYIQQELRRLHVVAEKTADALVGLLAELDAEHRPNGGERWPPDACRVCYPQDGSWPCVTRLVADELRGILDREDTDA